MHPCCPARSSRAQAIAALDHFTPDRPDPGGVLVFDTGQTRYWLRYIEPIHRSAVLLELAILGLLKEQDLHGYELKKRLSDTLGIFSGVSFGSLYPALARLEAAGAVKAVDANPVPPSIPLTGSLTGELAA